jgi:hypothetical protein
MNAISRLTGFCAAALLVGCAAYEPGEIRVGVDARVASVGQGLGGKQFADLTPGNTEEELLPEIGPPAQRRPVGIGPGLGWNYHYPTNDCLWCAVTVGPDHRYQDGNYDVDPICDERRRWP